MLGVNDRHENGGKLASCQVKEGGRDSQAT
jgi:hypothetical protein